MSWSWYTLFGAAVVGLLTAGGTAHGASWGLPYTIRPLVQQGSGNLLPPLAGAPASRAWQLKAGASVSSVGRESVLHLAPGGEFSITAPLAGGRLYRLDLESRFSPDTAFANSADALGLNGWVEPLAPAAPDRGAYPISEVRLRAGWQQHRSYFFADTDVTQTRISLGLRASKGAVAVRGISLREVPVEATAGLSVVDSGTERWAELPRNPEPARPQTAVLYHRRDPDRLFPSSAPTGQELTQPILLSGTPGEVLIAAAGLFTPATLRGVTLSLSALTSAEGTRLGTEFAWLEMGYHPRKTNNYGRGRTFHVVADSLWPRPKGVTAKAGETTAFWLNLTLPSDAAPGLYTGTLTAHTSARPRPLRVEIRVLPFTLVTPASRARALYADAERWSQRTDAQVVRELSDMKAHGTTSLIFEAPLGTPIWQADTVVGWQLSPDLTRAAPLIRQAGLRGPLIIEWWGIEDTLAQHLGVSPEVMRQHADTWPAKLGEAYLAALRAFDAEWKQRGWGDWVYCGLDEPGYWREGSPELFRFQYDAAAAAGLSSYCTSSDPPSDPIGRPLTYHCVNSVFVDAPMIAQQFLQEAKQYDQHVWFYASGSYDSEIGSLLLNRWITGFLFYKSGAEGTCSWTFQRPAGPNAFDDFYQTRLQWCITYPDPGHQGENLDTPHWEAIRQGWYDYRYAATLAEAIERAKQDPARRALAMGIEREFSQLLDSMPWSASNASVRQETNLTCDEWRRRISKLILRLR